MKAVLVIGGSDCSSGAGIQRDLKVLFEKQIYGVSVVTAITAQNSKHFFSFQPVSPKILTQQLNAVVDDFDIRYAKIGMLGSSKIVETLAKFLQNKNLTIVYDPVMKSSSGGNLMDASFITSIKENLFPLIELLTPNFHELERLLGYPIKNWEHEDWRRIYGELKVKNLLIKGGHMPDAHFSRDYLITRESIHVLEKPRIAKEIRGTGCSLGTSIVSELFLGKSLEESVGLSKEWLWEKIRNSDTSIFL